MLYFGFFAWGEFVALGSRVRDLFAATNALSFGMLATATLVLREPSLTASLEKLGFRYAYLFVLVPALFLLTVVEIILVRREKARDDST